MKLIVAPPASSLLQTKLLVRKLPLGNLQLGFPKKPMFQVVFWQYRNIPCRKMMSIQKKQPLKERRKRRGKRKEEESNKKFTMVRSNSKINGHLTEKNLKSVTFVISNICWGAIGITKNTGVPKIKCNNTGVPLIIFLYLL